MRAIDADLLKKEMWSDYCINDMYYPNSHEDALRIVSNIIDSLPTVEGKAQEPRVMTLEEVIKHYSLPPVVLDDLCWQEDYLQDIEPLYFDFPIEDSFAVHWRGYQSVRKYLEDWKASYGQNWRCWTSRPTNEQRRAVKWDE